MKKISLKVIQRSLGVVSFRITHVDPHLIDQLRIQPLRINNWTLRSVSEPEVRSGAKQFFLWGRYSGANTNILRLKKEDFEELRKELATLGNYQTIEEAFFAESV